MIAGLLWLSGFSACGAIKVAFEGDALRCAILAFSSIACAVLARAHRVSA